MNEALTPEQLHQASKDVWKREAKRLTDLRQSMMVRLLTPEETTEAIRAGLDLVLDWTISGYSAQPYKEDEKRRELLDLFYQQARFRALEALTIKETK